MGDGQRHTGRRLRGIWAGPADPCEPVGHGRDSPGTSGEGPGVGPSSLSVGWGKSVLAPVERVEGGWEDGGVFSRSFRRRGFRRKGKEE